MRMVLCGKRGNGRVRETLKAKPSPPCKVWRERLNLSLPLLRQVWRETLKSSLPLLDGRVRGTLKVQSFPCGGEDTTPKGVKFPPPLRVVTGVGEGRAL